MIGRGIHYSVSKVASMISSRGKGEGLCIARFFAVGDQFCQVLTAGLTFRMNVPAIDQFLQSFELQKKARPIGIRTYKLHFQVSGGIRQVRITRLLSSRRAVRE